MKISKEMKAGLIALLAIVSFVILFQFMKGKNFFSTDDVFYAKYSNIQGLSKSNGVSINGMKVGQVQEIKPVVLANGKVYFVVKFSVDDDYPISKNSVIEIFAPSNLSEDKELSVKLAYDNQLAKSGDTLKGAMKGSLFDSLTSEVEPVKDQISGAIAKLDSTLANANKVLDDQNRRQVRTLLSNLNTTISSLKTTSESTNRLIANNDARVQSVLDNTNKTIMSAKTAVDKYGSVAENVNVQKLNNAIDKLSETSDQLNKMISGINNGNGTLGKLTKDDQLYNNLNQTSQSLNSLITDLKQNPKRYINISVFGK